MLLIFAAAHRDAAQFLRRQRGVTRRGLRAHPRQPRPAFFFFRLTFFRRFVPARVPFTCLLARPRYYLRRSRDESSSFAMQARLARRPP